MPKGTIVPDASMVVGVPGRIVRRLGERNRKIQQRQARHYIGIWQRFVAEQNQQSAPENNIHRLVS